MTGRERLKQSLDHTDGPVPVDFGASATTGMHCSVVEALREYYGRERRPVKIHEPYQMLGMVEEDLQEAIGTDVVGVMPRNTIFGFPLGNWKEWRTPWGQEVLVPGDFNVTSDGDDLYIYPQGDLDAPPSGHMPAGGFFFDSIIRQEPIDDDALKAEDHIEELSLLSPEDLQYFRAELEAAAASGRGTIVNFGGMAFGDIAEVPGPGLRHPKGIRDITEWYVSTMIRQDLIHEIFRKRADIALKNLQLAFDAVGNLPDAVYICGTDFGTQTSQFCSLETFDSLYAPYYRELNGWIHEHTTWKTFKHSCGAVEPFMQPFIDAGFDIINPVQCSAVGMDPETLKVRYGSRLTFWGGGIDTQRTLPFGTPEEVKREAASRLQLFGTGGGYVFNAIHNIQAKTPVENVAALFAAVREYNLGRQQSRVEVKEVKSAGSQR